MNNEKKLNEIIEQLYVNDHNCSSAKDWREKFIKKLRAVICGESYSLGVGGKNGICLCNSELTGPCPTHGYKNEGTQTMGE